MPAARKDGVGSFVEAHHAQPPPTSGSTVDAVDDDAVALIPAPRSRSTAPAGNPGEATSAGAGARSVLSTTRNPATRSGRYFAINTCQ